MQYAPPPPKADLGQPMTPTEFAQILDDAIEQPHWRAAADKEADYADGNQLDSELLNRQKALGIPPAKENIIGPAINAVCGYEAKTRTDWRVTPDGNPDGQDVADALNFRLNQAERYSKADRAMSEAFKPMAAVGLGWVEVARESDPFGYPYRCRYVHRNEIYWDMRSREPDLSDARWLLRERFIQASRAAAAFPKHAEIIKNARNVHSMGAYAPELLEGGASTGLTSSPDNARAWTTREYTWYRSSSDEVCIVELWYRRWVPTMVLKTKTGRVVEFDESNPNHVAVVEAGLGQVRKATVARIRRSYWMGPVLLHDEATPYPHAHFPYVPFWGYREDMTGTPFGLVRDMIFPQDNLNSTLARLRWGMMATRTERTKDAVAMADDVFRRQVGRVDADIVLNAEAMARPGARFEVKRDFQLNDQQFQLMQDSRASLERVSGITAAMQGRTGTARSGLQEQTQLEQSQVSIAALMDNFSASRTLVGELLMAMVIEDLGQDEETIVIEGDTLNPPRSVTLNQPEVDDQTGQVYLSNDVQRTRMKVALEDVPSSSSFRAQQLSSLSEAIKSLPPEAQQVMMPFMIDLMDLPRKKEVVEALRDAEKQPDPEAMYEDAKRELMHELKSRELDIRDRESIAREKLVAAQTVQTGVQASYSAFQAGAQVAQMPQIAPVADAIMSGAGYTRPPSSDDPNFPTAEMVPPMPLSGPGPVPGVQANTSPAFPPVPDDGASPMAGIETADVGDNLQGDIA
ncbi:MAG: hypothetical protein PHU77_00200 [Simplicispira sp.]|nr:hypothetical protein [Simplicispira sp.]